MYIIIIGGGRDLATISNVKQTKEKENVTLQKSSTELDTKGN